MTTIPDVSSAGCPSILFSFLDVNTASTPDATIFSYVPGTLTLSISSSDFADVGLFNLKLIANFDGYSNTGELDFTVTLHDACSSTTLTVASSIISSVNLSYNIGYTMHSETLDNTLGVKVTSSPDVSSFGCPNIVFQV